MKFDFTIFVDPNPDAETIEDLMTESQVDELYETGLDDSLIGASCGTCFIDVTREANSLAEAIGTAIQQVESCGWNITSIEINEDEE